MLISQRILLLLVVAALATLPVSIAAQEASAREAASQSGQTQIGVETGLLLGVPEGQPLAGAALERVTGEISQEVRCPMCRGLPISSSPTGAAQDMVIEVKELLAQGYTREQILAYFERTYGEFVLLDPKTKDNWALYLAPIVMLLIGGGIIALRLRKGGDNDETSTEEDPELAEYAAQVRAATQGDATPNNGASQ